MVIPTADPGIVIEEQREGYVRYRRDDGYRWEVHGICDQRGDCLIGAKIEGYEGKGVNGSINSQTDLKAAQRAARQGAGRLRVRRSGAPAFRPMLRLGRDAHLC